MSIKKKIICCFLLLVTVTVQAKTVITINKSASICSVAFQTGKIKRIDGEKYLGFEIQDIKLGDLYMAKGSLESSVSSQWLNTGEKYFISAYINSSIGPKHIPITIPSKSDDYNRYIDINIDKYLPCSCFSGTEKPSRCIEKSYHDVTFRDESGNLWRQVDENTAERVESETR